jgi:hypothetical protein
LYTKRLRRREAQNIRKLPAALIQDFYLQRSFYLLLWATSSEPSFPDTISILNAPLQFSAMYHPVISILASPLGLISINA